MSTKTHDLRPPTEPASTPFSLYYSVIAPLIMGSGLGDGKNTACIMAQAATIDALRKGKTLDTPTDTMECACSVLRRMAIRANDTNWWESNEERTEHLRPLIPLLLDSRVSEETTWRRVFKTVDASVREVTPMRLEFIADQPRFAKRKDAILSGAKKLRELPEIKTREDCIAAREIIRPLRAAAYAAAAAAAYAAAYAYAAADAAADAAAAAAAQKLKYRTAYLELFWAVAAIKDEAK